MCSSVILTDLSWSWGVIKVHADAAVALKHGLTRVRVKEARLGLRVTFPFNSRGPAHSVLFIRLLVEARKVPVKDGARSLFLFQKLRVNFAAVGLDLLPLGLGQVLLCDGFENSELLQDVGHLNFFLEPAVVLDEYSRLGVRLAAAKDSQKCMAAPEL